MTQGALSWIEYANGELTQTLLRILEQEPRWHLRAELAIRLNTGLRQIRDAASQSNGQIVSSNDGLKLTKLCSQEEYDQFVGRFRSQVSEMVKRILATERVWQQSHEWRSDATV